MALLLSAALTGLLAGGACRYAMTGADEMLRTRVEKGLDDTLALMRLSGTAGAVATVVTQLETTPTLPQRQALHPALNQRVQQLGDAVDSLLRDPLLLDRDAERDRVVALRASAAALRAGVEDLNRAVDERLAVEHELRAVLEQVGARLVDFMETLDSLPPGGPRPAIEEAARALGTQLLDAGLSRAPMPKAATAAPRAAFRKTADTLLNALNALRIDHLSPRRAEAARRLVALGVDSGNLFDLRQEQARLSATAADTADALRARAEEVAAQSGRLAQALRDSTLAERDRIAAGLPYGPVGTGLAAALAVLAAGGVLGAVAAARARRSRPAAAELPPEAPPAAAAIPAEAGPGEERPPLHILLAEDEPVNQMAAMAILRRAGHRVTLASDGRAALAAVERGGCDLVLMDLRMPEMDGIEATRRILSRSEGAGPERGRPRIVMLTASAVPGDRERALAAGADEVLEKPLRYDALRPVLDRLFAGTRPPAVVEPPTPEADAPAFDDAAVRQMRELLPAERVTALVTGTVNTLNQYHARLAEAWAAGDTATVGAMAHKIAGVSGVYGCTALRVTAQALERAVETGEGDAAALVRQTTAALAPAVAFLEGQLAAV
ncbi:response regulator [Azospirillum rugosum]|uniref:response regulator n=1 Tax=Azospirillum rugosum TaxID=416170 RepID=UPI00278953E4|nr:response regulator [Azospirillum rugosum]MDQ0528750.1 CheY-like chemotaxis protein [Azospirillum rugosum]